MGSGATGVHTPCEEARVAGVGRAITAPTHAAASPTQPRSSHSPESVAGGIVKRESVLATVTPGGASANICWQSWSAHSAPHMISPSSSSIPVLSGRGVNACGRHGCGLPPRAAPPTWRMSTRAARSGAALSVPKPARADRSSATTSSALRVAPPLPMGTTEEGSATPTIDAPPPNGASRSARAVASAFVRAVTAMTSKPMVITRGSVRSRPHEPRRTPSCVR